MKPAKIATSTCPITKLPRMVTRTTPRTAQRRPEVSSFERGERLARASILEHDRGHDQRPAREQVEAGGNQEEEAERDPDRREDAGDDQGAEVRTRAREELADRRVDAPVADVVHGQGQRALKQEDAEQCDHLRQHAPERVVRPGRRTTRPTAAITLSTTITTAVVAAKRTKKRW